MHPKPAKWKVRQAVGFRVFGLGFRVPYIKSLQGTGFDNIFCSTELCTDASRVQLRGAWNQAELRDSPDLDPASNSWGTGSRVKGTKPCDPLVPNFSSLPNEAKPTILESLIRQDRTPPPVPKEKRQTPGTLKPYKPLEIPSGLRVCRRRACGFWFKVHGFRILGFREEGFDNVEMVEGLRIKV